MVLEGSKDSDQILEDIENRLVDQIAKAALESTDNLFVYIRGIIIEEINQSEKQPLQLLSPRPRRSSRI